MWARRRVWRRRRPVPGNRKPRRNGQDRRVLRGRRQEGQTGRKALSARERSKPLKGKPQGRYRYETRPEGRWTEEDVRRPRKPGDVAQPGEVSPVQVAVPELMRRRATNPMGGPPRTTASFGQLRSGQARESKTLDARSTAREECSSREWRAGRMIRKPRGAGLSFKLDPSSGRERSTNTAQVIRQETLESSPTR